MKWPGLLQLCTLVAGILAALVLALWAAGPRAEWPSVPAQGAEDPPRPRRRLLDPGLGAASPAPEPGGTGASQSAGGEEGAGEAEPRLAAASSTSEGERLEEMLRQGRHEEAVKVVSLLEEAASEEEEKRWEQKEAQEILAQAKADEKAREKAEMEKMEQAIAEVTAKQEEDLLRAELVREEEQQRDDRKKASADGEKRLRRSDRTEDDDGMDSTPNASTEVKDKEAPKTPAPTAVAPEPTLSAPALTGDGDRAPAPTHAWAPTPVPEPVVTPERRDPTVEAEVMEGVDEELARKVAAAEAARSASQKVQPAVPAAPAPSVPRWKQSQLADQDASGWPTLAQTRMHVRPTEAFPWWGWTILGTLIVITCIGTLWAISRPREERIKILNAVPVTSHVFANPCNSDASVLRTRMPAYYAERELSGEQDEHLLGRSWGDWGNQQVAGSFGTDSWYRGSKDAWSTRPPADMEGIAHSQRSTC